MLTKSVQCTHCISLNASSAFISHPPLPSANENADTVLRGGLDLHKNIVRVTDLDVVELVQVAPPSHAKATDALMITGTHTHTQPVPTQFQNCFKPSKNTLFCL